MAGNVRDRAITQTSRGVRVLAPGGALCQPSFRSQCSLCRLLPFETSNCRYGSNGGSASASRAFRVSTRNHDSSWPLVRRTSHRDPAALARWDAGSAE